MPVTVVTKILLIEPSLVKSRCPNIRSVRFDAPEIPLLD